MRPIERDEIVLALSDMRAGSAPGSDGLTVAFYKAFIDLLLPHLITLFDDICTSGTMPQTMQEAILVAILKPGKPPDECASYRPLSLMNVDANIFVKLLANRLTPLVTILVAPEQAGFVPSRNLTYNLRTLYCCPTTHTTGSPGYCGLFGHGKGFRLGRVALHETCPWSHGGWSGLSATPCGTVILSYGAYPDWLPGH